MIPHPDDEVFMAGLLSRAKRAGARVVVVCATRGERGWLAGRPAAAKVVADQRTVELERSCELLGVDEIVHLDLADGGIIEGDPSIGLALARLAPDVVASYGPDGGYGHRDHILVAEAVSRCGYRWLQLAWPADLWRPFARRLRRRYPDLIGKETLASGASGASGAPTWMLELGEREIAIKRAAAAVHASQLDESGVFLSREIENEIFSRELYRE